MTQRYSDSRLYNRMRGEEGGMMLFLVLALPALLFCAALALDLGQLYRSRIYLQKAADAGALAGMGYSIIQNNQNPSAITPIAQEAAVANMRANGLPFGTATATYVNHTLTVTTQSDVGLLLGFAAPKAIYHVTTEAESQRDPANIQLVLDYSSSMLCPRTGACECLTPSRTAPCSAYSPLKVDDLKTAVNTFIGMFDSGRDKIGMTLFNMAGLVAIDVASQPAGFLDPTQYNLQMNFYSPGSNTNITDGLMKAYLDLSSVGVGTTEEGAYLLFTDGAPTATRFMLAGARTGPGGLPPNNPQGAGTYDYTHWSINWDASYSGPGVLVPSQDIAFGWPDPLPPIGSVPGCSPISPPSNVSNFESAFDSCLTNLGFSVPFAAGGVYGADCGSVGNQFANCYHKQYYNTAIETSDLLRKKQGVVYVVGLGPEAPFPTTPFAPDAAYQDVADTTSQKTIFNARLANDILEAREHSEYLHSGNSHPDFNYSNATRYEDLGYLGTAQALTAFQ